MNFCHKTLLQYNSWQSNYTSVLASTCNFIQIRLTCAVDSISLKASITGTLKATKGVIAGGIHVTVVHLSFTLINIYKATKTIYELSN